jgi:hypothetical protein
MRAPFLFISYLTIQNYSLSAEHVIKKYRVLKLPFKHSDLYIHHVLQLLFGLKLS